LLATLSTTYRNFCLLCYISSIRPELRTIKDLFHSSKHGLEFNGSSKKKAIKLIDKLLNSEGLHQLLYLLKLLQTLSEAKNVLKICSEEYALNFNVAQLGRIKIVYDHIMDNFRKEVRIKEIADKLNISEAAFYKFIKKNTKKTYTQIINEFRINYATKLLMNSDKTIAQICFECGYNSKLPPPKEVALMNPLKEGILS